MSLLFYSKNWPGVVMNRFGSVLFHGKTLNADETKQVVIEAKAAGWKMKPSGDRDCGLVWTPPAAPEDGKGAE